MSGHEPMSPGGKPVQLSPADAEAVESLLQDAAEHGVIGRLRDSAPARQDARCAQAARWLDLIAACPAAEPDPALRSKTLARVEKARSAERSAVIATISAGAGTPFRGTELLAIAASVLVAFSLLWPALEFNREDARRIACATNLAVTGQALSRYAADYKGVLPRGKTQPGAAWWTVGQEAPEHQVVTSNSAHLFLLPGQRYLNPDTLNCPDNPHAVANLSADAGDWPSANAVSYSYQNQYTPAPIRVVQSSAMPVLADKNPLFDIDARPARFSYRSDLPKTSASPLHRSRGQNILTVGGRVTWSADPVIRRGSNTDNIWLISGIDSYQGNEAPDAGDAFLVP